jgi:hypothetical protein
LGILYLYLQLYLKSLHNH